MADPIGAAGRAYVAGEVLIQFDAAQGEGFIGQLLASIGAHVAEVVTGALSGASGALARAALPAGLPVETAIQILSGLPGVKFVEPNWVYHADEVANDPAYTGGQLWGMYGDQTSPVNQYGSQAGEAWASGFTGSMKVGVGIIDSGVDYTHKDLYLNIWLNQGEIPTAIKSALVDSDGDGVFTFRDLNAAANAAQVSDKNGNGRIDAGDLLNDARWENGADNDANGYLDDLIGWDFVGNDNDPYDDNSHGTHVAGTIGATGGDGTGVAGVNWQIQMAGLKFLDASGSGSTTAAIKALDYLTKIVGAGSPVDFAATNNSWGGGGFSQSLLDAIVRSGQKDILFVAAAGNGGSDGIGDNNDSLAYYPVSYSTQSALGYDSVVAVASLTSSGALSSFSNYGLTRVDLGAPGSSIYSTVPGGGYGTKSGTSMATPHVTGALALYTAAKGLGISAADLKTALMDATTATASLSGKSVSGGRLDLSKLLSAPADPTPKQAASFQSATDNVGLKTGALVNGAATDDATPTLNGSLSASLASGQSLAVYRDGTELFRLAPAGTAFTFTDPGAADGAHAYTARVVDTAGLQGPLSGAFNLTVDTVAPTQTAQITAAGDNVGAVTGDLANGAASDDASPLIKGALSAGLASGEVVAIYRDSVRVGQASVSGQSFTFQDSGVGTGAHNWQARVEDAAGNQGAASDLFGLNVTAPPSNIYGTTGSDNLIGTAGADRISGVPASGSDTGRGDVDKLTGAGGSDLFVLGETARGRFYDDGWSFTSGTGDYALIQDFVAGVDKIQLAGVAARYFFAATTVGGVSGLGIYYDSNLNGVRGGNDELIGLVKGASSLAAGDLVFV
ncbi:MAG TPA: S8 family serine peptidase [Phenylobacterium sp.]